MKRFAMWAESVSGVYVFKGWSSSSAPMLRRIVHPIDFTGPISWGNFFFDINPSEIINMLRVFLPDITIGTKGKSYRKVYDHVNHELSHASHFSAVGSAYWARYIGYIMTNQGYGNGSGKNAELCGVGEMWGYSMGEAAMVDGATPAQADRYITIPLMKNAFGTCVVLASVAMVSQFDIIYMTTKGGPGNATLNLPTYLYKIITLENNYGKANAVGVIQIALGLVLVILIQKLFNQKQEMKEV